MNDTQSYKKDLALELALTYVGVPYFWGGSSPMRGFDCSGLVVELLKSVGCIGGSSDYTSQGLHGLAIKRGVAKLDTTKIHKADILFFGSSPNKVTHVAIALTPLLMVEAGGGNSSTTNINRAIEQSAFVRIRPIANRNDLVGVADLISAN